MILYPDVQKKVQSYIDEVIDADKRISYSDRLRYSQNEIKLLLVANKYFFVSNV